MSFKSFDISRDTKALTTAINETVVITGSIYSANGNVKFYKNIASGSSAFDLGGSFETLYDSAPTSVTSSPLVDVTYGIATGSAYNVAPTSTSSLNDKIKIYRQFANLLLGNPDAVFSINSANRYEAVFVSMKRSLMKDEIRKGTVGITANSTVPTQYTASDQGAGVAFKQTVGGDYAPLKYNGTGSEVGQVWYNAGVMVLPPDLFWGAVTLWSGSTSLVNCQSSSTIGQVVDGFRTHTEQLAFNNQTNLQSSIWFCRAYNDEFNYSSNPTFVDSNGLILVTSGSNIQMTRTYITTVGLYDENDTLLAVGKANKPILKSPENECIIRTRLDF